MRSMAIGAAMLALAGPAAAQMGQHPVGPGRPAMGGQHWGGRTGGFWVGGMHAPGGYRAYRRPIRGYVLPRYWISPSFVVSDWSVYSLPQPPVGYRWSRYYDDAVLLDQRGEVYDSVEGIDWDRYDLDMGGGYAGAPGDQGPGGYDRGAGSYAGNGYAGAGANYAPPPRRNGGATGAVVGGVVGGAAGALVAGPHDRLAGGLIGAGVGAGAGYLIGHDRDRRRDAPPYGADYPPPPAGGYRQPMPYPPMGGGRQVMVPNGGSTTVVTTGGAGYGGGTWVNGGYYGAGVITVTIQSAPVVTTTTTTEYIDSAVTYRSARRYHVVRRAPRHSKLQCRCGR